MRVLIIVAGASLAISGCSREQAVQNTANADLDVTAENIVANDTTAIDAATNEAANMAAEASLDLNNLAANAAENAAEDNSSDETAGNDAD